MDLGEISWGLFRNGTQMANISMVSVHVEPAAGSIPSKNVINATAIYKDTTFDGGLMGQTFLSDYLSQRDQPIVLKNGYSPSSLVRMAVAGFELDTVLPGRCQDCKLMTYGEMTLGP